MIIFHLSDLHFGKHESVPDFLLKIKCQSPAIVVITGDLSNNGSIAQLLKAKQFIDQLKQKGFSVLFVPGNHDYSMTGMEYNLQSLNNFQNIFGIKEYPILKKIGDVYFIGLDSIEGKILRNEYYGIDGEIGDRQLNRLDKIISETKAKEPNSKIVVFLHHTLSNRNPFKILIDKYKLLRILRNRIDILMFGHSHVLSHRQDLENKLGIRVISESPSTNNFESYENHIVFPKKIIEKLKNYYIIPEIIINGNNIDYKVKKYKK